MYLIHKRAGESLITLKEIAKMSGVTVSTVSNVLNGKPNVGSKTRDKIMKIVEETGYQPNFFAQGIRKIKTRTWGIVVEDLLQIGTVPIVESIMAYAQEKDYRVVLMNMRLYERWKDDWYGDHERLSEVSKPTIQQLLSIKVDGIIYVAGHCRHIDFLPTNLTIPMIVVYGLSTVSKIPSVILDDEMVGYNTTNYILQRGHKRIGVLAGGKDNLHTIVRLSGYQKALDEAGMIYQEELISYSDWSREGGYATAKEMIEKKVSCIFCLNDRMAIGVYDYFYDEGMVVGDQISIVGCDNFNEGNCLRPRLTSTDLDFKQVGTTAAEWMVNILEDDSLIENSESVKKVSGKLVIRDSVSVAK